MAIVDCRVVSKLFRGIVEVISGNKMDFKEGYRDGIKG